MPDTAIAARLGHVIAVVIVGLARENFRKLLAARALVALIAALSQSFDDAQLVLQMIFKLRKTFGQRALLGLFIVIASHDRVNAFFERLGGLGDGILVALAQKDFAIFASSRVNGADLGNFQTRE